MAQVVWLELLSGYSVIKGLNLFVTLTKTAQEG